MYVRHSVYNLPVCEILKNQRSRPKESKVVFQTICHTTLPFGISLFAYIPTCSQVPIFGTLHSGMVFGHYSLWRSIHMHKRNSIPVWAPISFAIYLNSSVAPKFSSSIGNPRRAEMCASVLTEALSRWAAPPRKEATGR